MKRVRVQLTFSICVALLALSAGFAMAGTVEVFHADSLAGPMKGLKAAFEAKPGMSPSTSPPASPANSPIAF